MQIQEIRNQIKTTDVNKIESLITIAKETGQINKLWRPYREIFKWLLSWGDELFDNVDESYRNAKSHTEKILLINKRLAINESDSSHLYKKIKFLPSSLGLLCSLEEFSIGDNDIHELPKSFTDLINLKSVYLSNNNIWTLPKGFDKLQNLKYLNLDRNRIREIPSCIKKMPNLETLSLVDNDISKLPYDLSVFKNIRNLRLSNTNIKESDLNLLKEAFSHINIHY
ncbi:MAG: leucine-rich repeat domain-containing protein [Aureispira sp.]